MRTATIEVVGKFVDLITGGTASAERSLGKLEKTAEKAQDDLDALARKRVHPVIDVDNNKFLQRMRDSENAAKRLAGQSFSIALKLADGATYGVQKIEQGVKNLTRKTWTTIVKIKETVTAPLKKIHDSLFNIKSLALTIGGIFATKKFVLDPINLADSYSSTKIGFSTLLGDEEGQAMMDEMDVFAAKTPFKTSGVISNAQKMMAYGWDATRILDDMETIGNAAAATGKMDQGLESIVYALSEIRSKGKLSTQELDAKRLGSQRDKSDNPLKKTA